MPKQNPIYQLLSSNLQQLNQTLIKQIGVVSSAKIPLRGKQEQSLPIENIELNITASAI